jgi:hypothetical protein
VDWVRLGRAVTRRRVELGYKTIAAFAKVVELSTRIVGDLEAGRRGSYDPATLARVEEALGWPEGRVDEILTGSTPDDAGPRSVLDFAEIARAIHRDDFVPTWMMYHSGLAAAEVQRVQLLVRQRREEWERAVLWPEVAALITGLGGTVSYPWDEPSGD